MYNYYFYYPSWLYAAGRVDDEDTKVPFYLERENIVFNEPRGRHAKTILFRAGGAHRISRTFSLAEKFYDGSIKIITII